MRNMSNDAFGALHNIVKGFYKQKEQIQQLEARVNQTGQFADIEEAFQLEPQYKELRTQIANVNDEIAYWTEQLVACENGENWKNVVQGADGKFTQQETEAGPRAKIYLQQKLLAAQNFQQQLGQTAVQFENQHREQYKGVKTWLDSAETKLFGNVKLDFTKNENYNALLRPLPESLKQQPIYRIAAKLMTLFYMQTQKKAAGVSNGKLAKVITASQGAAGSSSGSGTATPPAITMDDFEGVMHR